MKTLSRRRIAVWIGGHRKLWKLRTREQAVGIHSRRDSFCKRGSLVIDDLPAVGGAAPNRGAAGHTRALKERVSNEVVVGGDFRAMEAADFPDVRGWIFVARFQQIEDELAAESPAGCADFPETRRGHFLEIGAGDAELGPVKDRLAQEQFAFNVGQLRRSGKTWLHVWVGEDSVGQRAVDDRDALGFHVEIAGSLGKSPIER
jgi:hypothetical protein